VAQRAIAFDQAVPHGDALVKDEAFALPQALLQRHDFQVFQDAAFQVEHVLDPLLLEKGRALFAADAASAEHGHLGRLAGAQQAFALAPEPVGKFAEADRVRIDRAGESADFHFIIVAGVDHDCVGIGNQRVPVLRLDIGAHHAARVDVGLAHGHDLALQPHFHAVERHGAGGGKLHVHIGAVGQGADRGQHRVDAFRRTGDGAVDPLVRQQQGAAHAMLVAQLLQRLAQVAIVVQAGKAIEGGHAQRLVGSANGGLHGGPIAGNCVRVSRAVQAGLSVSAIRASSAST